MSPKPIQVRANIASCATERHLRQRHAAHAGEPHQVERGQGLEVPGGAGDAAAELGHHGAAAQVTTASRARSWAMWSQTSSHNTAMAKTTRTASTAVGDGHQVIASSIRS